VTGIVSPAPLLHQKGGYANEEQGDVESLIIESVTTSGVGASAESTGPHLLLAKERLSPVYCCDRGTALDQNIDLLLEPLVHTVRHVIISLAALAVAGFVVWFLVSHLEAL